MAVRIAWSPEELLVAFHLYCHTPFGRLHLHNSDITMLAGLLQRTPSAVVMKACNFASLDPAQRSRNIRALSNVSQADRALWNEFEHDSEAVAARAAEAYTRLTGRDAAPLEVELDAPQGPTEVERVVRVRRVQRFFASAVLVSYDYRCALSDIAIPALLNASHIIPWSANAQRRADPRNGIALNALYDRAFDRGLLTLDASYRVVLSPLLKRDDGPLLHRQALLDLEGRHLRSPHRFVPDPAALAYHREHVFIG